MCWGNGTNILKKRLYPNYITCMSREPKILKYGLTVSSFPGMLVVLVQEFPCRLYASSPTKCCPFSRRMNLGSEHVMHIHKNIASYIRHWETTKVTGKDMNVVLAGFLHRVKTTCGQLLDWKSLLFQIDTWTRVILLSHESDAVTFDHMMRLKTSAGEMVWCALSQCDTNWHVHWETVQFGQHQNAITWYEATRVAKWWRARCRETLRLTSWHLCMLVGTQTQKQETVVDLHSHVPQFIRTGLHKVVCDTAVYSTLERPQQNPWKP